MHPRHMPALEWVFLWTCLLSVASVPVPSPNNVGIVHFKNIRENNGGYQFGYKLSDGTTREETGRLAHGAGTDNEAIVVRGSYSYIGPNGILYKVSYVADENGYRPQIEQMPISYARQDRLLPVPSVAVEEDVAEDDSMTTETAITETTSS